jgi:hypothetical protein
VFRRGAGVRADAKGSAPVCGGRLRRQCLQLVCNGAVLLCRNGWLHGSVGADLAYFCIFCGGQPMLFGCARLAPARGGAGRRARAARHQRGGAQRREHQVTEDVEGAAVHNSASLGGRRISRFCIPIPDVSGNVSPRYRQRTAPRWANSGFFCGLRIRSPYFASRWD